MHFRILELYSGIGGIHCAWNESGLEGEIVAAVDINTVANMVYAHNFPKTRVLTRNIQKLTRHDIEELNVNTILMSPPFQPFTRNGKYLDENDPRINSFIHIINLLTDLECIQYILMENVKGFVCSTVYKLFIQKLDECTFQYEECLLCSKNFGIPNCRLRYYCIARRGNTDWKMEDEIMQSLPDDYGEPFPLEQILDKDVPESYLLPDNLLKRAKALDICYKDSRQSCCFTKAYSYNDDGTGSVFTNRTRQYVKECYERANKYEIGSEEFINVIRELNLRFFTPNEVLRIMAFPEYYSLPTNITKNQCYRLLGNTVNVKVISILLKILCA